MKDFNLDLLYGGHSIIIGERKVKDKAIRELLCRHDPTRGALVVLDYDGKQYENYNGKAILADFTSRESVVPNLLETLLHSKKYGGAPKTFSMMAQKLHAHPKPDRGSNDAFWSSMSTATFRTYVEYLCAVYKIERRTMQYGAGEECDRRDLALFGRHADKMVQIMNELTISCSDRDKDDRDAINDPLYKLIERYVHRQYGEKAQPFSGTIRNPGASYSGTFQSILLSTFAVAESFFKLMELMEEKGASFSALPELDMMEFVSKPSVPLFLCGSQSQQANQALGAMTLMAAAAAAHGAGKNVTVVIPELERWNLSEALAYAKGESLSGLSTVVSCTDLRKLAALAGTDKRSALSGLAESSDKQLWLYSTDTVCEELFEACSSVKARSYRLNELGEQFAAYRENGKDPEYFVMPESEQQCARRKVRIPMDDDAAAPWIDRIDEDEQQEIDSLLYGGLPQDLFFELEALGYTEELDWTENDCKDRAYKDAQYPYAAEVLCKFLMDDKKRLTRRERRIRYSMKNGKYILPRTLTKYDLKLLIKRCRYVLKREVEQKKKTENTIHDVGQNSNGEDSCESADSNDSSDTDGNKEENKGGAQ